MARWLPQQIPPLNFLDSCLPFTDVVSRITAIHRAKKLAYMRACESAFSKFLLVVLPNGKVAVEVDCSQSNKLDFATDDELKGVVKVRFGGNYTLIMNLDPQQACLYFLRGTTPLTKN